jgi:iron(III) transport system substrate-binding protein
MVTTNWVLYAFTQDGRALTWEDSMTVDSRFQRRHFGLPALGLIFSVLLFSGCTSPPPEKLFDFKEINLTSSVAGVAPNLDANLQDAWGLEFGDPGRIWVNTNTGFSIVYDGSGKVAEVKDIAHPSQKVPLRVSLPALPGAAANAVPPTYTGMVFNPLHGRPDSPFQGDAFIFVSEDGIVSGWHPLPDGEDPLQASIRLNNNAAGAVYKGAASYRHSSGWRLYLANFGQGEVDVFDASYHPVKADAFSDPQLPVGYAPFNIKAIGDEIFVTYAKQSIDKANDVKGLGNGYVDVFTPDGKFLRRLAGGGLLNSPWGLALAPKNYGPLSNLLLIGNFGDGYIHVYDPVKGTHEGTVAENAQPLQIDGLWALTFGTDNGAGSSSQLFFTAGSSAESQGIFGQLLLLGVNVPANQVLTIYSGQHQQTVDALVEGFQKQTGIRVSVRSDDEGVLTNQIVEEGAKSPADVFITENSPALEALAGKNFLSPVSSETLAAVSKPYESAQGNWVGLSARVSTLVYNTSQVKAAQLPANLLDLAKPEWKGKVGLAPSETDFQPLVTAVVKLYGQAAALEWLKGLKDNSEIYPDNETVVASVNSGQSAVGLINHYYWYRLRDEVGAAKMHSALHYFSSGDAGNLVDVSGAAVLKSSAHQDAAQKFLAYLVSPEGQNLLAWSESYEYPLGSGVKTTKPLPPFDQVKAPAVGVSDLGDGAEALALLRQVGLL